MWVVMHTEQSYLNRDYSILEQKGRCMLICYCLVLSWCLILACFCWVLTQTTLTTRLNAEYCAASAHNKTGSPMNRSGNRKSFLGMPWRHIMSCAVLIIIIYDRWNSVHRHSFVSVPVTLTGNLCWRVCSFQFMKQNLGNKSEATFNIFFSTLN